MARRLISALTFILLMLVLIAWLWPLLLGESLFWGLPTLQFYPWRSFAFDQLRAGILPLWNPYNGGGAPLLANYQTAVLYPPNWLHLVLPHVAAMNLLAVGHIVWAAVGMWCFTGAWRLPAFGRAVSTLAFALSGYLIARLGSFPTTAAASWMPWLFLASHRLLLERRRVDVAWMALAVAMLLLAGHAQTAYYVLLGTGAYVLWLGWWMLQGRARLKAWGLAAAAMMLGVSMAAAQLLPTFQLLRLSERAAGLGYDWVTNFSYSPIRALNLLSPNIFGTPADGSYITEGAYFEDAAYIGLLPLVAAVSGFAAWIRRWRRIEHPHALNTAPFWAGMAILAFLIALGKNGPLFPLLYRFVPTFSAFQGPVRWLLLTVFALSVLAGIGVSYGWYKTPRVVFWSRLFAAGGAGMVVVAAALAPHMLPDTVPAVKVMIGGFVTLGAFVAGCAVLTLLMPSEAESGWRGIWQALALVFVAFDLFWAFRGLNPTVPAAFFRSFAVPRDEAAILYMPASVERHLKFEVFFPLNDYRVAVEHWPELRTSLLPNLNMLDGVPMFNNFDPIRPRAYVDAAAEIESNLPQDQTLVRLESWPRQDPFGEDAFALGAAISGISLAVWLALLVSVRRLSGGVDMTVGVESRR